MVANQRRRIFKDQSMSGRPRHGVVSVSHLATVLFLTVIIVCVINVGAAIVDRNRQQRIADNLAETLGTFKARNLNAVTSQQHLIGELLAMAAIHHAIGGVKLDEHEVADTKRLDRSLRYARQSAELCRPYPPFAFDDVVSPVYAGRALLKSHRQLKKYLTMVYYAKTAAAVLMAWPPTHAAGQALGRAADFIERIIHAEWKTLEQIRRRAVSLSQLKLKILYQILPESKKKLDRLIDQYPRAQQQLANQLGDRWGAKVHILPSDRRLPIKKDPLAERSTPPPRPPLEDCDCPSVPATNLREQLAKVSQLSRATFPWVNYHRQNLVQQMKAMLPLSGMGGFYFDETAGVTKRFADELQRPGSRSLVLYVLDDYDGPDKAYEPWVKEGQSQSADKSFGLTVLVGVQRRAPVAGDLFGGQSNKISYRIASSFSWNRQAPKQRSRRIDLKCKRIVPTRQASTGWDTLNYGNRVSELVGIGIPHVFPAIKPQWNSQLVPTSPARIDQLRRQELPRWASGVSDLLPTIVNPNLVGV